MKRSLSKSQMSAKSGKTATAVKAPGHGPTNRNVVPPSLPSNIGEDAFQSPQFNSIGYYGDLLGRLDNQIKTVEEVYKQSFYAVQHQQHQAMSQMEGGKRVYQLHELQQVKPKDEAEGKLSVVDTILQSQLEFYARTAPKGEKV